MRFSFKYGLIFIALAAAISVVRADEPAKAGKFDDTPAVAPQIVSEGLKLPALWDNELLPQYRLRAAHHVVKVAREKALKNLASQIGDIKVTDKLFLSDIFKKSDQPDISMMYFLRGVSENGLRYRSDCLAVEVELEISLKAVMGSVKCWLEGHLSDEDKVLVIKLRDKIEAIRGGKLRAMGIASVDMEYVRPRYRPTQEKLDKLINAVPKWISRISRATGEVSFNPNDDTPATRNQAFAEAAMDAKTKLKSAVDALEVAPGCSMKDFVAQHEQITKDYQQLIADAGVVEKSEVVIADRAEASVSIPAKKFWNLYLYYRLKGVGLPKVKSIAKSAGGGK